MALRIRRLLPEDIPQVVRLSLDAAKETGEVELLAVDPALIAESAPR